jgi:lysophospholipase L1-like esterase
VVVTFGGKAMLHLPPGGEADSDPVELDVIGHVPYAISLYLGSQQRLQAWHRIASQVNFISEAGDHTADIGPAAFRQRFTQFAWVTSFSVADGSHGGVIAIGDSITDGLRSTIGGNHRWPDELARRLVVSGQPQVAVLNAGISGNRLLSDSSCYGERMVARFEREIVGHAGIRTAILLIGINDINFAAMPPRHGLDCDDPHTQVSAADLIAGYRRLAETARRHQVRLLIGTLTPADLPSGREAIRQAVNQWIRSTTGFDGVVDFDLALRDPVHPQMLRPVYDSGDHIHPSDAGYAAMAEAVPLGLLIASTTP